MRLNSWPNLLLGAAGVAVLGCLYLLFMSRTSELPTVEQLLSPGQLSEIQRLRKSLGQETDVVLAVVAGSSETVQARRLGMLERRLAMHSDVLGTASLGMSGPRRSASGTSTESNAGHRAGLIVATLRPEANRLSRARALADEIEALLKRDTVRGERIYVSGTPWIRAASWDVARADLHRMVPLLIVAVFVVPLLFFRSLKAAVYLLTVAASTTAVLLAAYQWLVGAVDALMLTLVPIVWAVAVMDAMHLYQRAHTRRGASIQRAAALAAAELRLPCLLTTITTAGALLALTLQDQSRLLATFGLWGALGAILAYAVTFSVGRPLLVALGTAEFTPRWPRSLTHGLVLGAQRRARWVTGISVILIIGFSAGAGSLQTDLKYPDLFAPDATVAGDLEALERSLGTDLAPTDIYVEATDAHGRSPRALLNAVAALTQYLKSLPEQRFIFPADLLAHQEDGPARENGLVLSPQAQRQAVDQWLAMPGVSDWVKSGSGVARVQLHLEPISMERRGQLLQWLSHFDETMLSHHRLVFDGPGYLYWLAETQGLNGAVAGAGISLLLVVSTLMWTFRRWRIVVVALTANIFPWLVVGGIMGLAGIHWSLALLPLPAVLLGLAVDDTIHLLWPLRNQREPSWKHLRLGALRAGPALLATTVLLTASVATMLLSDLQPNRELGLLLATGMIAALAGDLLLVPALARILFKQPGRLRNRAAQTTT